jgi:hypothetical protein
MNWVEVGAIGSTLGGIGAAVGGLAAWRSASASRAASSDSRDALAIGIFPVLELETFIHPLEDGTDRGLWTARIINASAQFAASHVAVEATFRDGYRISEQIERIVPGGHASVVMRDTGMPPGGPTPEEEGMTLVLRYSDERQIARYEQPYMFILRKDGDGNYWPTGSVAPETEPVRIA